MIIFLKNHFGLNLYHTGYHLKHRNNILHSGLSSTTSTVPGDHSDHKQCQSLLQVLKKQPEAKFEKLVRITNL